MVQVAKSHQGARQVARNFRVCLNVFKKNRKLRRLTREHISKNIPSYKTYKSSKIQDYTRAHALHDVKVFRRVNVHVNTGANGNLIKAVREGSIILRFERAAITSQRKNAKSIPRVKGISRPGVFRDHNQRINKKSSSYSLLGPALKSAQRRICLNLLPSPMLFKTR